jgi:multiple antibiotic resistance protein
METTVATIITMYMVMLGPIKLILPFAHATANIDAALKREIAIRTTLWGGSVALICLLVGDYFVTKFLLSGGELAIALSFFLLTFAISIANVGDPAQTADASPPPEKPTKDLAVFPLAFPGVIPPQGFALLVLSTQLKLSDATYEGLIPLIVLILIVMAANFACMLGAGAILRFTGRNFWLLLSRFLSPVLLALSVHYFFFGLNEIGIISL